MLNRKIYVVGGVNNYANWMQGLVVKNMEEADLVVFTGGEDVDPSLYNQPAHRTTWSNLERDLEEQSEYKRAKELGKPCLGICRGSQFLCVMSGGQLVQDQPNPAYLHKISTYTGDEFIITSTHHQAAYPFNMDPEEYRILGWTKGFLRHHKDGYDKELSPEKECEIVYYPKVNNLGIQGHPEMMDLDATAISYLRKLLDDFLNGSL